MKYFRIFLDFMWRVVTPLPLQSRAITLAISVSMLGPIPTAHAGSQSEQHGGGRNSGEEELEGGFLALSATVAGAGVVTVNPVAVAVGAGMTIAWSGYMVYKHVPSVKSIVNKIGNGIESIFSSGESNEARARRIQQEQVEEHYRQINKQRNIRAWQEKSQMVQEKGLTQGQQTKSETTANKTKISTDSTEDELYRASNNYDKQSQEGKSGGADTEPTHSNAIYKNQNEEIGDLGKILNSSFQDANRPEVLDQGEAAGEIGLHASSVASKNPDTETLKQGFRAAERFVATSDEVPEHAKSYLGVADLGFKGYQAALAQHSKVAVHQFLYSTRAVLDELYIPDAMREALSPAASFISGTVEGITGIKHVAIPGHEVNFYAGKILGSSLGLATDVVSLLTAATLGSSGMGLTVTSGGLLVPAGALATAQAAVLAAAAAKMSEIHLDKFAEAIQDTSKMHMDGKWRTEPIDLQEQAAMKQAKSGGGRHKHLDKLTIHDPRYKDTHKKMQVIHHHPDGTQTKIHYWLEIKNKKTSGHKFKDEGGSRKDAAEASKLKIPEKKKR